MPSAVTRKAKNNRRLDKSRITLRKGETKDKTVYTITDGLRRMENAIPYMQVRLRSFGQRKNK